jgi:hypothetical protein
MPACVPARLTNSLLSNIDGSISGNGDSSSSKLQKKRVQVKFSKQPFSLNPGRVHASLQESHFLSVMLKVLQISVSFHSMFFSAPWSIRPRPDIMTVKGKEEKGGIAQSSYHALLHKNEFCRNWFCCSPRSCKTPSCYSCRVGRSGVCSPSKFW